MEESGLPFFRQHLVGRKIVIILPMIIIIAAIILSVTILPKSYYFTVRGGELLLVRGPCSSWVVSQRSSALEPFSVKGLDLKGITGVAFKTQDEAMGFCAAFFRNGFRRKVKCCWLRKKSWPVRIPICCGI